MKILLVGGGGREHALAWRLAQDDPNVSIVAAPGNPGIAELAECVPLGATDLDGLLRLARDRRVDFTVVGPEAPLAAGIVDRFREARLPIFGPTRAAAEIETSKSFAKTLMRNARVPTARAIVCTEPSRARGAAREFGLPVVIKASGLAAGKGVIVCETIEQADQAVHDMMVGHAFGVAGQEVLVEEFMTGEELSVFAITDGENALTLVPAQDHKRLLDGDRGPNTGGMGAYAPVSLATDDLTREVRDRIFKPTLAALAAHGRPFTGLLYAGLMLTDDGPRVVEFNARFGDPETQAVLPVARTNVPFAEVLAAVARGEKLPPEATCTTAGAAVTTVLAAEGYPEKPRTGDVIELPPEAGDVLFFHAGTARDAAGGLVTAGGRVLSVTGIGSTFAAAQERSRDAAARVGFHGKQFRSDIGWREAARRAGVT
ncbi:MAG TPA: phosphoribosylamine--glycine ligase [Gemmatimonadaceae bacterium]|nr:phosphoribosylamine--glycine ligase [Gemmatimonadaceae bacterium]